MNTPPARIESPGMFLRDNIRLSMPTEPVVSDRSDKVKLAVITSIRDVGREDQNGRLIQTAHGERYMPGVVEMLVRMMTDRFDDALGRKILAENPGILGLIRNYRDRIAEEYDLVGIVSDDHERDDLDGYDITCAQGGEWILPAGLRNQAGELVDSITHHMPSEFRRISGKREPDRKRETKSAYEGEILDVMREMGAEVILSDHLMFRIDRMLDPGEGLVGRIVNIHPAITNGPTALRGAFPTQDAIDRADEYGYTGATFHMINKTIDDGPLVADTEPTHITSATKPMDLRYMNYSQAKTPALIVGLDRYFHQFLPMTDGITMPRVADINKGFEITPNPVLDR